jgi:hypothetical protein
MSALTRRTGISWSSTVNGLHDNRFLLADACLWIEELGEWNTSY